MNGAVTIKLAKPVKAHGEEVSTLELREPTTKDIRELGYPLDIGDGSARPNAKVICHYVSRLAAVPMSTVDSLRPSDFNEALQAVLGFFEEEAGSGSSIASST